ncbi:MAG TPA: large conductance mechanosensitive channel protein MscL [Candidatus Aquilonibacter sp.]|nr:large conductance mechanosensitive channel protein MscL [Candidatus Aquilonibacter sp.]
MAMQIPKVPMRIPGALSDFKDFVSKGNVAGLAAAVVFGVAFNAIITSFISNIITPILGIPGHADVSSLAFTINGSTITYGLFINAVINFIVIAAVLFFLIIRPLSGKKGAPTNKTCRYCYSTIPIQAIRCPNCTSKLPNLK